MKDFYIGYMPRMPNGLARFMRPAVIVILGASVILAAVFALGQGLFGNGTFEFGNVKEFSGTIQAKPIPFLILELGRRTNGLPGLERVALVGEGKFGADDEVRSFDGSKVKLRGTLIYRDGIRMIEVAGGSVKRTAPSGEQEEAEAELGEMTLKGEIIDSKCYLGGMNPGNRKTHRSCAVACLRGGIPAMFLVKDRAGKTSELWLLDRNGYPAGKKVLDYVAEPLEMNGVVKRRGDSLFMYADLGSIRRL